MYRGFNLTLSDAGLLADYFEDGKSLYSADKASVKKTLSEFSTSDGSLSAARMQENWFPKTDAHVFISHSHKDETIAVSLAGMLKYEFGISAFIDSCAWGYSSELLQLIDNEFCWNDDQKTYNYNKRNSSTSHVHMMLVSALSMMIDRAECLIFLNTPAALTPEKTISGASGSTSSPWIYAEIAMTQVIRRRNPDDHRGIVKHGMLETLAKARSFDILHDVNLDHLTEFSFQDLRSWRTKWQSDSATHLGPTAALDVLYGLKPPGHQT